MIQNGLYLEIHTHKLNMSIEIRSQLDEEGNKTDVVMIYREMLKEQTFHHTNKFLTKNYNDKFKFHARGIEEYIQLMTN